MYVCVGLQVSIHLSRMPLYLNIDIFDMITWRTEGSGDTL